MAYLEKDFQSEFNKLCRYYKFRTAAFELKCTKEKSLAFNKVEPHQKANLLLAKHRCLVFKIPDLGSQNPFDSFILNSVPAYIVIMFEAKSREFVMINIDNWVNEEKISKRKSITKDRAYEIGTVYTLAKG